MGFRHGFARPSVEMPGFLNARSTLGVDGSGSCQRRGSQRFWLQDSHMERKMTDMRKEAGQRGSGSPDSVA